MDPIVVATAAKQIQGLLPSLRVRPSFGPGNPKQEEADCDEIQVFMYCVGITSLEKRRIALPVQTPVSEVRERFGRDMSQDLIFDENDFQILDTHRPISHFSNKCLLNLKFVSSEGYLTATGNAFSDLGSSLVSGIRSRLQDK